MPPSVARRTDALGRELCRPIGLLAIAAACFAAPAEGQTQLTVNTDELRSIGGVTQLDRERFFTHTETVVPPTNTNIGNLSQTLGSPTGLNAVSGRISTEFDQFIAQNLPEDAGRPGFIDPTALRNILQGSYRNFVTAGSRYAVIRSKPNAYIVNSGRYGAFWPSYFIEPGTGGLPRADAYTEFLTIYLDEVHFGPNAFYPVAPDRFAVELVNEPDLHFSASFTRDDYVDYHQQVTAGVHATFPQAIVGGPSLAVTSFEANEFGGADNFSRFEERIGDLITGAGDDLDYYSIHPYQRYDVQSDGSVVRQVDQSVGRINGQLDMIRARDIVENPGRDPLPIALTEYGSFNRPNSSGSYGNYTRSEQQWDLARNIRQQLLVYLNRPDVVLNATPFVQGKHFSNDIPTPENADNVLFEQDAQGQWSETIVGNTLRAYNNVSGSYIGLENANPGDLQALAFRDGNEVYVLLNNLLGTAQDVDLTVLTALGTVQSATIDRLARIGTFNLFSDNQDVTGSFQNLTLNPEEGAVLTLTLSDDPAFGLETEEKTFYSPSTILPFTSPTGATAQFSIDAEVGPDALSATLRFTYNRPGSFPDGEDFRFTINGTLINIPAGVLGIDDGDFGVQTREVDVPIGLLVDGVNQLVVDFNGGGGFLASTALTVTSDLNVSPGIPGDFDGDGDVDLDDFGVFVSSFQNSPQGGPPFASGDFDEDGDVDLDDFGVFVSSFQNFPPPAVAVPEPSSVVVLVAAFAVAAVRPNRA